MEAKIVKNWFQAIPIRILLPVVLTVALVVGTIFLLILPMLMFGEGFLNGAAMSLVVAYRPQWVATFHDRWYLQGK